MYIPSRIDKAIKEFLLPPKNTRTSHFYGLPKNHKPDCPPRDIVSGFDGPTDHLSPCVTHFIQPRASNIFLTSLKNSHRFHIHKHSTQRRHSSRDSLHGRIQAATTHKMSTTPYSTHNTRFHPQT